MMKNINKILKKNKSKKNARVPYALSSKPQRYGPGVNRAVINVMKEVSASYTGRFALQTLLQDNTEFSNKKGFFKFFKIVEIRATFLPANVVGAFNNIAVMFSWWLTSYNNDGLYKDDSTRFVPVYRTRPRTLRFLPPRTVLDVQTTGTEAPVKFFDFSQFLSTDMTINFPGWLYVSNPSTSPIFFNYEAVILFRGNDFMPSPSTRIQEENPFIDKFFSLEKSKLDQPPGDNSIIFENDNGDVQLENDPNLIHSKESKNKILNEIKINKIKQLQEQIDLLRMSLSTQQEDEKEDEKISDKEDEKEFNKQDLVSRKNKPK